MLGQLLSSNGIDVKVNKYNILSKVPPVSIYFYFYFYLFQSFYLSFYYLSSIFLSVHLFRSITMYFVAINCVNNQFLVMIVIFIIKEQSHVRHRYLYNLLYSSYHKNTPVIMFLTLFYLPIFFLHVLIYLLITVSHICLVTH